MATAISVLAVGTIGIHETITIDLWAVEATHVGAFSCNDHKNLTCGEGGGIVVNDDTIAERVRWRSIHAISTLQGAAAL
jgi:hypothetical protein